MQQGISDALLGELLLPQGIVTATEAVPDSTLFWQEQMLYFHDYSIFITICFGLIIGLMCVLVLKRK